MGGAAEVPGRKDLGPEGAGMRVVPSEVSSTAMSSWGEGGREGGRGEGGVKERWGRGEGGRGEGEGGRERVHHSVHSAYKVISLCQLFKSLCCEADGIHQHGHHVCMEEKQ